MSMKVMSMKGLKTKLLFSAALFAGIIAVLLFAMSNYVESSDYSRGETATSVVEQEGDNSSYASVITPIIEEVNISAAGAYTLDNGELYNFRADKRWPIASITKLMTAVVANKLLDPKEVIRITDDMLLADGSSGGFVSGESFTVEDLVEAMLVVSSNDAASAVSIHYGEEKFINEMNKFAEELGMIDTTFVDPTGLSIQNLSTVEDLVRLTKYIFENEPGILKITRKPTDSIINIKTGTSRKLENINIFAGREDFIGGKTGQIPEAGGNLLSVFSLPKNGSTVIIVVLGANDRFGETEKILSKL
jgi:D-alanyl-D-alanine carboxypeptidase